MTQPRIVPMVVPGALPCKTCGQPGVFFLKFQRRFRGGHVGWTESARCDNCAAQEAADRLIETEEQLCVRPVLNREKDQ